MIRQAIATRFLGPTNHRGARVRAYAEAGSVTLAWDHRTNVETNHVAAAHTLAAKLGWNGTWQGGALPGAGYCFVLVDSPRATFTVAEKEPRA